jgi:catechol 2,3-dioxygenase-like lactoylglutathione lyase family enzyme
MTRPFPTILAATVLLIAAAPAHAQMAAFGDARVVMGHLHVTASDAEEARAFWLALGGEATAIGPIQLITCPGVNIAVRVAEPTGDTIGSVINHVGFNVPDVAAAEVRWTAAGLTVEPGGFPAQRWITAPGGTRIEILEAAVDAPVVMHHVHWNTGEIPEMQAWYARAFGAVPGMRGRFVAADIPGANLTFTEPEGDAPLAGTAGRGLDHVGFEAPDLRALLAHLEAEGIALDEGYREVPDAGIAIAYLTDPWGTRIELTDTLEP